MRPRERLTGPFDGCVERKGRQVQAKQTVPGSLLLLLLLIFIFLQKYFLPFSGPPGPKGKRIVITGSMGCPGHTSSSLLTQGEVDR